MKANHSPAKTTKMRIIKLTNYIILSIYIVMGNKSIGLGLRGRHWKMHPGLRVGATHVRPNHPGALSSITDTIAPPLNFKKDFIYF